MDNFAKASPTADSLSIGRSAFGLPLPLELVPPLRKHDVCDKSLLPRAIINGMDGWIEVRSADDRPARHPSYIQYIT
jgi:hypothetical protein